MVMRRVYLLVLAGMMLVQEGITQPQIASKNSSGDVYEFPSVSLHFSAKEFSIQTPSQFTQGWPLCSPDGTTLFRYIQDKGLESGGTMSLQPHGIAMSVSEDAKTVLFPYDRISNLYNAQVRDADMTDDLIIFHLWAGTVSESTPDLSTLGPATRDASTRNLYGADYIALFKRNGEYIGAIRLELPFKSVKLAILSNDRILVLGVEKSQGRPILAIIDNSGRLQRYLDTDNKLPAADNVLRDMNKQQQQVFGSGVSNGTKLIAAMSKSQFTHHGTSILLLVPGTPSLVLEIMSSGTLRPVSLRIPEGMTADAIVPSTGGNWVVRCHGRDDNEAFLMEFDTQTGALIRQIGTGDLPTAVVTCIDHGTYIGFHWFPNTDKVSVLEGKP